MDVVANDILLRPGLPVKSQAGGLEALFPAEPDRGSGCKVVNGPAAVGG